MLVLTLCAVLATAAVALGEPLVAVAVLATGLVVLGWAQRQALKALEVAKQKLEQKVHQTTKELDASEFALQLSEARKAAVFEAAIDAIISFDSEGDIIEANPASESVLGLSRADAIGRSINDFVELAGEDDIFGHRVERTAMRANGQSFPAEVVLTRTETANRSERTVHLRDITERKQIDRMKDEFISIVSHELRTPLTAIRGSLGLLEGGVAGEQNAKTAKLVTLARSNTDRLIRLINDILDLEKIEAGSIELSYGPVDAEEMVRGVIADLQSLASEAGVTIDVEIDQAYASSADHDRVVQVLTNLISNAVKYSACGDRVVVEVGASEDGNVRFAVRDEGPGVSAGDQQRIFQRFQQVDSSDSRAKGGSGLGLAIARAIVEEHGGTIGVVSEPGEGAEFYFTLSRLSED